MTAATPAPERPADPAEGLRWEVFGRRTASDDWAEVGYLHAPDAEMALLLARDTFFRHEEGVDLAVSRGPDFFPLGQPELLEHATDKSYRLQRGYTGLGAKRRLAAARAAALGAVVQRRRPPDLRVLNEDHR